MNYIDFLKLQRDAINADFAARMFLFIMQGGVERGIRKAKKASKKKAVKK